nr:embryonic stem cell-specific 5-hydroxymethylcytosine-binding protein [Onthophagus taurus]
MCGRLACSLDPEEIHNSCTITKSSKTIKPKWKNDSGYTYKPFYNGPPTTVVPVLTFQPELNQKDVEESLSLVPMKWGFTPSFEVNPQALAHTHNCRLENVLKSSLYRDSLNSKKRCVVVAEGFYEWQTASGPDQKQPFFIYQGVESKNVHSNKKHLMHMAGLWTIKNTDEGQKYSCTILTMESDDSLNWLHHRMPIILNTDQEILTWLDFKRFNNDEALKIVSEPFNKRSGSEFKLKSYTVNKKFVNKSTCNEKECMVKFDVKRPNTLDSWLKPAKKAKMESV